MEGVYVCSRPLHPTIQCFPPGLTMKEYCYLLPLAGLVSGVSDL